MRKVFDAIDWVAGGGIGLMVHQSVSHMLLIPSTDMIAGESIKMIFTISTVVLSAVAMHYTRKFLNKK